MKNIIIILTLVFSVIGTAQSVDSLFVKGNDLYKQEKYHKAIESYKEIENSGVASDELYYNLGNSYYKLNEVAPSIYYYEKALKLNPFNEFSPSTFIIFLTSTSPCSGCQLSKSVTIDTVT